MNQIWNYLFQIHHNVFVRWNWDIEFVQITLSKNKIIWETAKKFRIEFTELKSFWWKLQEKRIHSKLYDKDKVNISESETIDNLYDKISKFIQAVKDSDRISEYKKNNILVEIETFLNEKWEPNKELLDKSFI